MRCRNCMTEVEDGTLFCPECGARLITIRIRRLFCQMKTMKKRHLHLHQL